MYAPQTQANTRENNKGDLNLAVAMLPTRILGVDGNALCLWCPVWPVSTWNTDSETDNMKNSVYLIFINKCK